MPKQITQAELRAVLDDEAAINRRMMLIRNRLRNGAKVETGDLGAVAAEEGCDWPVECTNYHNMGLLIDSASAAKEFAEGMERAIAAHMRSKLTVIRALPEVAHA